MSESQTMKTAIHECAHGLLHDKDIMKANGEIKDRMTKEIEAESCAFVSVQPSILTLVTTPSLTFPDGAKNMICRN